MLMHISSEKPNAIVDSLVLNESDDCDLIWGSDLLAGTR